MFSIIFKNKTPNIDQWGWWMSVIKTSMKLWSLTRLISLDKWFLTWGSIEPQVFGEDETNT